MKSKAETNLMHAIMIATCDTVDWMRNNIGVAEYGKARVAYGVGGTGGADLVGILRGPGRWVSCEVKIPGEEPKPKQYEHLRRVSGSGGLAFCAHSVKEAKDYLTDALNHARRQW